MAAASQLPEDMSASTPGVAARVRALAGPRGIAVLDTPVAGMVMDAIAGGLRISVGGDAAPNAQVYPATTTRRSR